jgi:hypothetical protein
MKVRIKKVPQARTGYQVQGSLANDVPAMGGADYNTYIGKPSLKASKYMTAVPREEANLEAEGGETVYGDINGDGMPEHKTIKGPRHSGGGVPLNLPDDTFIYSDFRGMNIKEPEFLQMFGKGGKGNKSYTPAALAKQYDIEKYRKILQDPDSDKIDRKTAELMIKNYQNKLAALALVQEGKKGFPQGMPAVAKPMTAENQYTEDTFVDPSVKQFASQIDGKLKEAEQNENTAEQDPDFAQQAQQAQEMNEGQPVAQPGEMEQPMAQYGMAMGGYDLPFAQSGIELGPIYTPKSDDYNYDRNQPGMQEYLKTIQRYNELRGKPEFVPVGEGPLDKNQTREYRNLIYDINEHYGHGTAYDPETGEPIPHKKLTPEEQLKMYKQNVEDCPCMKKVIVQGKSQNKCVPCEQLEMAQYGMSMGGYDLPYGDDMPEAEYGMSMGITSKNYMGRPKSAMYARGGALRTYQGAEGASSTGAAGGAPAATTDDGTLDVTGLDPDASNKKYQIWMKHNPGKEPKIMLNGKPAKYVPPTKPTGDLPLSDLKAINEIGYKMLEKEITNPNSKVRATLIEEAQAAYKDPKTGGKIGISKYRKNRAVPTGDEIINGILTGKKRNDAIKESGMDMRYLNNGATAFDTYDELKKRGIVTSQDEYDKKKKEYESKGWDNKDKIAKTLKITLPTPDQTLIEQTGAHGIARMQNNKVKGAYNKWGDDDAYQLETLFGRGDHDIQTNTGGNDETEMAALYGDNYNTLSPIEGFAGQSTLAHGANPNTAQGKFEAVPEEKKEQVNAEPCPCTRADGSTYELPRNADGTCPPCETEGEATTPQKTEPKMWLQDKIKTAGAFGDLMSAKKYTPWAAKYDLRTPKPTFMDPTRELAANAEQANIQTQALGQFAGPQALSARSSGVMGAASKNAADVLAKYNNANVNIANQFESNIANIENQEQQLNTASQQKLYDQNTISNQQYDNTKRALRNNLMNQTTSGITNKMKTDALNQLYPQYQVHPETGGGVDYDPTKAKQIKHEMSGDNEQAYYEECSKRYKDEATIQKCVDSKMKNAPSGGGNSGRNAFDAHNAKEGGFVYGDVTYPFIL